MKRRRRTRWTAALLAAGALSAAFAAMPSQQGSQGQPPEAPAKTTDALPPQGVPVLRPVPSAPAVSSAPVATFEGQSIATELPPEVKRLIDGVRRLHEQPGLILDREAIYQSLGVKRTSLYVPEAVGGRTMREELAFVRPDDDANWRGSLRYSEFPEIGSWSVRVELSYSRGPNCYPSRLLESYWGKPFVFRPMGSHGILADLLRRQAGSPTGPHEGVPYDADFRAVHANSASVTFFLGRGGCLIAVAASNLFNLKEFSDDHIYHQ